MKLVLKAFGLGVLLLILVALIVVFGSITFFGFKAILTCIGYKAVGLFFGSIATLLLTLFLTVCLGAVPLAALKNKKPKEKER